MGTTQTEIKIDLGTAQLSCTPDEIAITLAALIREMRTILRNLRPDERGSLRQIMSHQHGMQTVSDVFPAFVRDSESHKTLRRLRAAQFIRPARTGQWQSDIPIEVKAFARLLWDRIGEAAIYDDVPAAERKAATATAEQLSNGELSLVYDQPLSQRHDDLSLDLIKDEAAK